MEIIPGVTISISMIVGLLIKVSMILLVFLGIIMVRQESLMDKVVNVPIGKGLKALTWGFFLMSLFLTIVILLA